MWDVDDAKEKRHMEIYGSTWTTAIKDTFFFDTREISFQKNSY